MSDSEPESEPELEHEDDREMMRAQPGDLEKGYNLRDPPQKTLDYLLATLEQYKQTKSALPDDYYEQIDKLRPRLNVPATQEECEKALETFSLAFEDYLNQVLEPQLDRIEELDEFHYQFTRFDLRLALLEDKNLEYEQGERETKPKYEPAQVDMWMLECSEAQEDASDLLEEAKLVMSRGVLTERQVQIQKILSGQSEELKRRVLSGDRDLSGHLDKPKARDVPEIAPKSNSRDFPVEIASMVYSFCTLETSVALRETNSFWYNAYKLSDRVLKPNLLKRNPWMKPEGQMLSFGDCILVFCARLKKWSSTDELENVEEEFPDEPIENDFYVVAASGLEYGEKLPSNFEPAHHHFKGSHHSHRVHAEVFEGETRLAGSFDLRTLELDYEDDCEPTVISSDDTKTVIECYGIRMTLPGNVTNLLTPNEYFSMDRAVTLGENSIVVRTEDDDYLFSRDNLAEAITFNFEHGNMEIGGVYVIGNQDYDGGMEYALLDPSQDALFVFQTQDHPLMAIYNGLIWWHIGDSLVPAFLDLEDPELWHYNIDMSITCCKSDMLGVFNWQAGRFLISRCERGRYYIDLETQSITNVQHAYEENNACMHDPGFIAGWQDGRFVVRSMHDEVLDRYYNEANDKLRDRLKALHLEEAK